MVARKGYRIPPLGLGPNFPTDPGKSLLRCMKSPWYRKSYLLG